MLTETYKRNLRNIKAEDPNAEIIDVTWECNSPLASYLGLEKDFKDGKITHKQYKAAFKAELLDRHQEKYMLEIAEKSLTKNIYLVSANMSKTSHRFLLLDIIKEIGKKAGIVVDVKLNTFKKLD